MILFLKERRDMIDKLQHKYLHQQIRIFDFPNTNMIVNIAVQLEDLLDEL